MSALEEYRLQISSSVRVYYMGGETPETNFAASISTITIDDQALVVDTGLRPDLAKLVLKDLTSKGNRKLTVVNTHHHGDHTICNQIFAGAGAHIISHSRCREALRSAGEERIRSYANRSPILKEMYGDLTQTLPDLVLNDSVTVFLGGEPVELSHPGRTSHTQGDLYVHFPSEKILFTGDLLFSQYHPNLVDGDLDGWIETCEDLRRFDVETVIPGHGPPSTSEELATQAGYFRDLKSTVKDGILHEKSPEVIGREFLTKHSQLGLRSLVQSNIVKIHSQLKAVPLES